MAQQERDQPIEQSKSAPVLVTRRFDDFEAFSLAYAGRLSLSGLFVAAIEPLPVGATVHADFQLNDGFRLFHGVGEVVWVRPAALGPDLPSGMGVRFLALDEKGRELILKLLEDHIKSGGLPFELEPPPDGAVTTTMPLPEEPMSADPMDFAPPWQQELPDIPVEFLAPDRDQGAEGDAALEPAPIDDRTVLAVPPVPPVPPAGGSDLEPIAHSSTDENGDLEERGSGGLAAAVARLEPLPGGARAEDSRPISLEMESVDAALDFGLDPAEGWVQDAEPPQADTPTPAAEEAVPTFDETAGPVFDQPVPDAEAPVADFDPPVRDDPAPPALDATSPDARAQSWLAEPDTDIDTESGADDSAPAQDVVEPLDAPVTPVTSQPPARRSLLPLIALLALAAVAAAGWFTRERWLPLLGGEAEVASVPTPSAPVAADDSGDRAAIDATTDDSVDLGVDRPLEAPSEEPLDGPLDDLPDQPDDPLEVAASAPDSAPANAPDSESDGAPDLDQPSSTAPVAGVPQTFATAPPEALETPSAQAAAPGRRLENISWRETAEGTLVIFEADGPLSAERLSWSQLGGANPRLLIRLRDIVEPYRANQLTVASAAVQRIRTGFHPSPAGSELHVVLDLVGPGFALASAPEARADGRIEILIAAP